MEEDPPAVGAGLLFPVAALLLLDAAPAPPAPPASAAAAAAARGDAASPSSKSPQRTFALRLRCDRWGINAVAGAGVAGAVELAGLPMTTAMLPAPLMASAVAPT